MNLNKSKSHGNILKYQNIDFSLFFPFGYFLQFVNHKFIRRPIEQVTIRHYCFIEVPLPIQESEWSCIQCMFVTGLDFSSVSMIF
jgi:hypothetical protein